MSLAPTPTPALASSPANSEAGQGPYYGWLMVVMAALAMAATMPGRTHGLSVITERLLADNRVFNVGSELRGPIEFWRRLTGGEIEELGAKRILYSLINFWATVLGAMFCLGFGRLIDKVGSRIILTVVVLGLAGVVLGMTVLEGVYWLFVMVLLTRGLGQSALSVVSITLVGKWFKRRQGPAMGVYSALMGVFFTAAFVVSGLYKESDWRVVWRGLGWCLLILAPIFALLVRDHPEQIGQNVDGLPPGDDDDAPSDGARSEDFTLWEALGSSAFWIFALATSLYGLISSGTSLFFQSILTDLKFPKETMYNLQMYTFGVGLLSNLGCGWLARRWSINGVMAIGMGLLSAALLSLPFVKTFPQVVLYGVTNGVAGGAITVVFFMVWGRLYGRAHLGQIQGIAQMLTVFGSAVGPVAMAVTKAHTGSYLPVFLSFVPMALILMAASMFAPMPRRSSPLPEGLT